jgi:hypothetical protein
MIENIHQLAEQKGLVRAVAEKIVDLPVEVDPPLLGSRMLIWKQDPSVKGIDLPRTVYLHTQVDDGPKDSQITIHGVPIVTPNSERDFLISPANEQAFDAVHTYTIVRQTLTMYQREDGEDGGQMSRGAEEHLNLHSPHLPISPSPSSLSYTWGF